MKREIITRTDPKSPVSEVFRTLRTNLQYMNNGSDKCQTIVTTSTVQGEGKSFVTANLAVTFAQAGKKTLIIDADMRRPRQHPIFGVDMYPGLSNYLSGINLSRSRHEIAIEECIYKTKIENLYLMPSGNIPPNPSELLQSRKLKTLLEELEPNFDVIIFDGAPCLLVTDSTIISRLVDATIIVASQGKTKIDDLKEAKRRINRVGGHIAGVVLNRVKISKSKYGEKYYESNNNLPALGKQKTKRRFAIRDDDVEIADQEIADEEIPEEATILANEPEKTSPIEEKVSTTKTPSSEKTSAKKTTKSRSTRSKKLENTDDDKDEVTDDKIKSIIDQINKLREGNE